VDQGRRLAGADAGAAHGTADEGADPAPVPRVAVPADSGGHGAWGVEWHVVLGDPRRHPLPCAREGGGAAEA